MASPKNRETIVIKQKDAPDITIELAEYLDILGSPMRLTILKLLESEPMDVQAITHHLHKDHHITCSREHKKPHRQTLEDWNSCEATWHEGQ